MNAAKQFFYVSLQILIGMTIILFIFGNYLYNEGLYLVLVPLYIFVGLGIFGILISIPIMKMEKTNLVKGR